MKPEVVGAALALTASTYAAINAATTIRALAKPGANIPTIMRANVASTVVAAGIGALGAVAARGAYKATAVAVVAVLPAAVAVWSLRRARVV